MRFTLKMIATAAFAALVLPAFLVYAEEPPKAPLVAAGDTNTDPGTSAGVEPAAFMPGAGLMPGASMDAPTASPSGHRFGTPRFELFLGYSYLHALPNQDANRLMWLNGGSTSLAFNFNRYFGIVGDFAGFDDSKLRLAGVNPATVVDSTGTVYTYMGGPRLSFRGNRRLTPFVQALFGEVHASEVTYKNTCTGDGCTPLPPESRFTMTAGVGVDYKLNHHFAIRVIQAEYLMTRFENLSTGQGASQNDMRLSSGVVFRFGGHQGPPPPPPAALTYSCSVTPTTAFPGDTFAVVGTAENLGATRPAVYTWTADGGTVTGTTSSATITTVNLTPGSYTLKGHVSAGTQAWENADCTTVYVVKQFEFPTVSCSANPSTVVPGDSSVITAVGVSPQNRPLVYSFTTTVGTVTGTGATTTLATAGAPPGVITVSCNVVDDRAQSASATTTVTVAPLAVAQKPATSELCAIQFERDPRRPARVDNEAKACLDGIALNLQRASDARIALVGNASSKEKKGSKLAAQRAANTKAYLVTEKGIDAGRVAVYTGSQDAKTVTTIMIPAGATMDATGDVPVN